MVFNLQCNSFFLNCVLIYGIRLRRSYPTALLVVGIEAETCSQLEDSLKEFSLPIDLKEFFSLTTPSSMYSNNARTTGIGVSGHRYYRARNSV